MEGRVTKISRDGPVNPERKYIRLQEVGLAFCLSILPAIMLADMLGLGRFTAQIIVGLIIIGAVFFSFGLNGREELAKQREAQHRNDGTNQS